MPHRHHKPGARIFVRSTSFGYSPRSLIAATGITDPGYNRKNFFAKRRMRAGRCAQLLQLMRGIWDESRGLEVAGHTSPTLGVGGNLLCRIIQCGLLGVGHASRVEVPVRLGLSVSRRNNLFLTQRSRGGVARKRSPRSRDGLASPRDGFATRSDSLRSSASRRSFALDRKPRRLLYRVKRKLSKWLSRQRVLIFRSINRQRA